jgi:UDPglucose--hexose-1-phosphate uridylyltransferase
MSKYVPDILSRRWVIIAGERVSRPDEYKSKKDKDVCPFCAGNESHTPPEVFRYGKGEKDTAGWQIRVFPNKYSITDFHEVIVHSPDHHRDVDTLPAKDVELIFKAYRERYNFYKDKGQVLIFNNRGEHAGASISHPHSQLVVIPSQINLDTLTREPLNNIVDENNLFNIYCPDFSQWPYEVWLAPKKGEKQVFGDITDEQITDLVDILQKMLKRLKEIHQINRKLHSDFGYNFYIHPKENWYMRIIPRFIHRAGFELGTGLSVNIIDPTQAAQELREEKDKMGNMLKRLEGLKED